MKKMMMIAVMAIVCLTANAPNEVGQLTLQPKVGLNFANLSGANYATTGSTTENSNIMVDFALGVEAEYGLAKNFSVAAGIMYSRQGCDYGEYKASNGYTSYGWDKFQHKLGYLTIPIVANFYFAKGWAIKAGIQMGFMVTSKIKMHQESKAELLGSKTDVDIDYAFDYKDQFEKFDLSIPIGISYQFKKPWVIDARYQLGLTKLNKQSGSGIKDLKNSVFMLTFGYKFAL